MRFNSIIASAALVSVMMTACASTAGNTSTQNQYNQDKGLGIMLGGTRDAAAFEASLAKAQAYPLGSAQNPVRANGPASQRAYLNRLICPTGDSPSYNRDGSFGAGPYETTLDRYSVTCSGVAEPSNVYMDMYHSGHEETQSVDGFTIKPPGFVGVAA